MIMLPEDPGGLVCDSESGVKPRVRRVVTIESGGGVSGDDSGRGWGMDALLPWDR